MMPKRLRSIKEFQKIKKILKLEKNKTKRNTKIKEK